MDDNDVIAQMRGVRATIRANPMPRTNKYFGAVGLQSELCADFADAALERIDALEAERDRLSKRSIALVKIAQAVSFQLTRWSYDQPVGMEMAEFAALIRNSLLRALAEPIRIADEDLTPPAPTQSP